MAKYEVVGKDVLLSASRVDYGDKATTDAHERLEVGEVYDESEIPDSALESFPDRFDAVRVVEGEEGNENESEDTESSDDFNAEEFIDGHHAEVVDKIEHGEADGYLDEVRDAEESRENGPRDSVTSALDER